MCCTRFVLRSWMISLLSLGIFSCCLPTRAADGKEAPQSQSPTSAQIAAEAFKVKEYAAYLNTLPNELQTAVQNPQAAIEKIVMVAIALEKTRGWKSDAGEQARTFLADSPDALRYLDAIRLLLGEDTTGLGKLYESKKFEPYPSLSRSPQILREHGYELAANCLCVITGEPGRRAVAWLSIPAAKRAPVDAFMEKRYPVGNPNRRQLAECSLNLYIETPKEVTIAPKEFLALAKRLGQGVDIVSFNTAERLTRAGKYADGVEIVKALVAHKPTDAAAQCRAAMFCIVWGFPADGLLIYQTALQTVPSPHVREVRLAYLGYLSRLKKMNKTLVGAVDPVKLETGDDLMLAADALLLAEKYEEAEMKFREVCQNPQHPPLLRLEAWSALLESFHMSGMMKPNVTKPIPTLLYDTYEILRRTYHPKVLEALFGLTTTALDCYTLVVKDLAKTADEAELMASRLENEKRDDLKPLVLQLRANYPQPK
ncbi:MAG: hypothetical protein ACYC7E_14265 [Armatimonadota bacterium]